MLSRPSFKAHFHVEVTDSKTVFLLSEQGHFVLKGRLYALLAPLLTGNNSVEVICAQLQEKATFEEVFYSLDRLYQRGYISEAGTLPTAEAAFWELLNQDATAAYQQLQQTKVTITPTGNVISEPFTIALASLQIQTGSIGDVSLVITDDYLHPDLARLNREALETKQPWLLAKPVGGVLWLGPFFRPGYTACWECLAQRLKSNREIESSLQEQKGISTPFPVSRASLPSTLQTAANLVATEVAKWIVKPQNHPLENTLLTIDLTELNIHRHTVTRRPQCPYCGDRSYRSRQPKPILLTSQPKQFMTNGGYRNCLPDAALQRYQQHISPVTGIIRTLVQPFASSDLVHNYVADHSFPRAGNSLEHLRTAVTPKSYGKGKTDTQAKMSAIGEAIERYSGSYMGDEPCVKAAYRDLAEMAIHPCQLMHYSETQYRERHEWNSQHNEIQWVPDPFDENRPIDWSPIWSFTHQTFKHVPTAYCYYGYPLPEDYQFCYADTNGTAAGSCKEEAILQGFMELAERDAVAIWWYNRLTKPCVNLNSFNDPYLNSLQSYYQKIGREFWVLDLTSDLNIPTFAAISRRTQEKPEGILFGFGTHFDPKLALLRAITEMNQMIFLSNGGNPTAPPRFSRQDMQTWCDTAAIANQPYLVPDANATSKSLADYPQYQSQDLQEDVLCCIELAAQHGLEVLVLDQTQPDVGMNVIKVIVPGLRHFWAQFAPGRLYDVPVQMGWLKSPLSEQQLNPIPMFL